MHVMPAAWVLVLVAMGGTWQGEGTIRTAGPSERASFSPLARDVLAAGGDTWVHMESRYLLVHTQSSRTLADTAREADYAYAAVGDMLGLEKPARKPHLFVVGNEAVWDRVLVPAGVRAEGLSIHFGQEVFLKDAGAQDEAFLQVPHEIVHLRLAEHDIGKLPLWLEEGLAGMLAWEIARAFHAANGSVLERTPAAVAPADYILLDRLVALSAYPETPGAVRAFYRQTEELVRAVADLAGRERLGAFVRAMAASGSWEDVLRHEFHCSEADIREIEKRVRAASVRSLEE